MGESIQARKGGCRFRVTLSEHPNRSAGLVPHLGDEIVGCPHEERQAANLSKDSELAYGPLAGSGSRMLRERLQHVGERIVVFPEGLLRAVSDGLHSAEEVAKCCTLIDRSNCRRPSTIADNIGSRNESIGVVPRASIFPLRVAAVGERGDLRHRGEEAWLVREQGKLGSVTVNVQRRRFVYHERRLPEVETGSQYRAADMARE
jgi:hypothetical protein